MHVREEDAEAAAEQYAHMTPSWSVLTGGPALAVAGGGELDAADVEEFAEPDLEDLPV